MSYAPHLEVARAAADAAAALICKAYRGQFDVQLKADASPVTEVDIAAEKIIRDTLSAAFPDHAHYGEELGRGDTDAEYLWLIDPIDGTKAFVRGYPMFSVQIALMHRGELVMGVSCAPCWNGSGETAWAVKGEGAWLDGERIHVSTIDTLAKATLDLLTDTARREALQADLASVVATLGTGGAYSRAAQAVHQALLQ